MNVYFHYNDRVEDLHKYASGLSKNDSDATHAVHIVNGKGNEFRFSLYS